MVIRMKEGEEFRKGDTMTDIVSVAGNLLQLSKSDFTVSTGLLIHYNESLVFAVHNPDRWVTHGHTREAAVVGVGGKLERGETVLECVKRECREEINTDVKISDSEATYVVTDECIRKFTLDKLVDEPRPYFIIGLQMREHHREIRTVVFTYKGEISGKPTPGDVSALLLVRDSTLLYLASGPKTVAFMRKHSATFVERIHLPDDLVLVPCGTFLTYLRMLEYWHENGEAE
jgi:8-oxo-dGTP pyrophosphatase MutT (NUDIX family)